MPKFIVGKPLQRDGTRYVPGQEIDTGDMDKGEETRLLADGVLLAPTKPKPTPAPEPHPEPKSKKTGGK